MGDTSVKGFKYYFKEYFSYAIIIVLVLLFEKFVATPIKVDGSSRFGTLHDGDIMILNIICYRFSPVERFDILVIDDGDEYLIKRVIGLPGETIEYIDSQLYINGKKIKENYGSKKTEDFKTKVPKDSYFVLGDNRTNSRDSRYYGAFLKKKILGKTKITIFPFNRFGNKK